MRSPEQTPAQITFNLEEGLRLARTAEPRKIDPESFADLYGPAIVQTDLEEAAKLKAIFRQREGADRKTMHQYAEVFEAVLAYQGEMNDWFGENAHLIRASEYDDFKNGVDIIAEIKLGDDGAEHLALALDISFQKEGAWEKGGRLRQEIERGALAKIKYFVSKHLPFRGELRDLPRFAILAKKDTLAEVAKLWLETPSGSAKILENHPLQFQILEQLQEQCLAFIPYARLHHQEKTARAYEKALRIIEKIIAEKQSSDTPAEDNDQRDEVSREFVDYLRSLTERGAQ